MDKIIVLCAMEYYGFINNDDEERVAWHMVEWDKPVI